MLPQQHKITNSEEFRQTIRKGKRAGGGTVVVHLKHEKSPKPSDAQTKTLTAVSSIKDLTTSPPRFGLIVSKAVGNAVVRHAVSRKLRPIMLDLVSELAPGDRLIIRALPPAATATSKELTADVQKALGKIKRRG
ncbi:ribonuclease P protein component [Corynebacterium mustelae]|uniref:Ribonuclease P protein component n=1 Tax=Corynebacterium mustelae TaxID=571915 RepID=A0A0G3H1T6_9CORY|nr:ribonuclease P protein component [Corynebacterium mustelae]AKK07379.1 ribonuclease P protein component [Corynebacterium mustelae]